MADKILKVLGIVFMILGGLVILVVSVSPLKLARIDQLNITRILVGIVLFYLGYYAYKRR